MRWNMLLSTTFTSINDQPCDMGPNAMLEKYYNDASLTWRRQYTPNVPLTVQFFNNILVAAYTNFAEDPKVYHYYHIINIILKHNMMS